MDKLFIIDNTNNHVLCKRIAKKLKYRFIDLIQFTADKEMIDKTDMLNNYGLGLLHNMYIRDLKTLLYRQPNKIPRNTKKIVYNQDALNFLNNDKCVYLIPMCIVDWIINNLPQLNRVLISNDSQYITPFSFDLIINSYEKFNLIINKIKNINNITIDNFTTKRQLSRNHFKNRFKVINNNINMIKCKRNCHLQDYHNDIISAVLMKSNLYQLMTKREEYFLNQEISKMDNNHYPLELENINIYTIYLITDTYTKTQKYVFYTDTDRNIYSYKKIINNMLEPNMPNKENLYVYQKDNFYFIINKIFNRVDTLRNDINYNFLYVKDNNIKLYQIITYNYLLLLNVDIHNTETIEFIFRDIHPIKLFNQPFYVIGDYDVYLQYQKETERALTYIHSNWFINNL